MITNPEKIEKKYKCNKYVKNYLIYNCRLPLMSFDRNRRFFYFADTDKLRECLEKMPLWLKIVSHF